MRWSWILCAIAVAGPAHAQGVFRGPYLNNVTTDAITVLWESPANTTGVVRYRSGGGAWQNAASGTGARHHEVRLTGLAALAPPGSAFEYEVDVGGTVHRGRFHTAIQGRAPFEFVVYGDNRSSPQQHQVVVDALLRELPAARFAVNTGDLVDDGETEADWDAFFPVAQPFLAQVPLFVAIGNHEVDGRDWDVTRRIFDHPVGGTPAANDESYYRLLYGNVELIVINVEVDSLYTLDLLAGDQEEWLTEVLAQPLAGADHRFLFLHQGPYSSKPGRNGNFWLRQWLDELKAAGIDVIFSGHDHYAERGWTENGLYYVVHGGGGAPLYNTLGPRVTNDHTIVMGETRLGYAVVKIDGPRATVEIKGIGGEIVDSFSYGDSAAPACRQASDCGAPPRFGCPGGAWECARSSCRFACGSGSGSLVSCVTDNACQRQLGATCAGTVSCEHPSINPTSWYCACVLPPDCMADGDCAARPSPIAGCTGTWGCVDQVCEFTTAMCQPVTDGGPPAESDGGASPDGTATGASDAGPIEADATGRDAYPDPFDARAAADDALPGPVPAAPDATASAAPDAGVAAELPVADEGCGCATSSDRSAVPLALALAALALRRRRAIA